MYGQLIFNIEKHQYISMGKGHFYINHTETNRYLCGVGKEEMSLNLYLISQTKINCRWLIDQNVKSQTIKLLEEKPRVLEN